jgi:uncharacterized protein (TIGR02594 family)
VPTSPAPLALPTWLQHARAFERMMIVERPGPEAHPLITAFFQFTQLAGTPAGESDETPWCSAFVCACVELAGLASTKHALAHSWLNWGVEIDEMREGCILVFEKTNHVAFANAAYTGGSHVWTLGGNQQNKVCSRLYEKDRIISMRWSK